MKSINLPLALLFILLAGGLIYYLVSGNIIPITHSTNTTIDQYIRTEPTDRGYDMPIANPKIVAILAYNLTDCLYCKVVEEHLSKQNIILNKFNINVQRDYMQFISYLKKLNLDYEGVPTVLIGRYAFLSYQDTSTCPSHTTEINISLGNLNVTLCKLKDYPNYYLYVPSMVEELIKACSTTKHQSCYTP